MNRWIVAIGAVSLAAAAAAQQARDGGASAGLQAMVQQLTVERMQLQDENRKLKSELDAAAEDLKKLRDANAGLERRLRQTEASLTQASASSERNASQAEQQRARLEELIAQFRQTIDTLRQTELERNQLRSSLEASDGALRQCAANNQKLFDTGLEILDRYEQKGCWASLRDNEPFTQNKRVQLENLVDEYRWRLEDELLAPPPGKSAARPLADASANAP